jgi:hypothetical protein
MTLTGISVPEYPILLQEAGWMAGLLDLICSHPPATQPGLKLLTVIASSPKHWGSLLEDAAVFRVAAELAPGIQQQPEVQQQLLELIQQVVSQALRGCDQTSASLGTDEELMGRAIRMLCNACSLSSPVPQLLLDMLTVDNSAAVRQAMISSGALDCILQNLQHDAGAAASCNTASLQLLVALLGSELQGNTPQGSSTEGNTVADFVGQRAVEAGAFAGWIQQLQSSAEPSAAVLEAVALVMRACPTAVESVAQDGVLSQLLWLLWYAFSIPEAKHGTAAFYWLHKVNIPKERRLLINAVRTVKITSFRIMKTHT